MLAFEAGVLLRTFTRPASYTWISLALAPLIAVLALRMAPAISAALPIVFTRARVDYAAVFLAAVLFELPLSAYGYPLTPPASILERLVVAGSFAVVSVLTAKSILNLH